MRDSDNIGLIVGRKLFLVGLLIIIKYFIRMICKIASMFSGDKSSKINTKSK